VVPFFLVYIIYLRSSVPLFPTFPSNSTDHIPPSLADICIYIYHVFLLVFFFIFFRQNLFMSIIGISSLNGLIYIYTYTKDYFVSRNIYKIYNIDERKKCRKKEKKRKARMMSEKRRVFLQAKLSSGDYEHRRVVEMLVVDLKSSMGLIFYHHHHRTVGW